MTNAPHSVQWNGYTWLGVGALGGIEPIMEGSSLEARGVALRLSGVPLDGEGNSENIAIALGEHYQGRDCRIWVAPLGANAYLQLPGEYGSPAVLGNFISTPDSSALDISGDIDIRVKLRAVDWTPSAISAISDKLATVSGAPGNNWLWRFATRPSFRWSSGGTDSGEKTATADPPHINGEDGWLRVTHEVDNGAGGNDVKHWTSTDYDPYLGTGTWTQLGSTVTTAGTTARDTNNAQVSFGYYAGAGNSFAGRLYYAEVRNGIDGTVVARFDPTRDDLGGLQAWTVNKNGPDYARIVRDPFSILADPKLIFLGRMDNMEIEVGATATITLRAESRLADLERPRVRRYNDADQRQEYPGDLGLWYAEQMVEKAIRWGS